MRHYPLTPCHCGLASPGQTLRTTGTPREYAALCYTLAATQTRVRSAKRAADAGAQCNAGNKRSAGMAAHAGARRAAVQASHAEQHSTISGSYHRTCRKLWSPIRPMHADSDRTSPPPFDPKLCNRSCCAQAAPHEEHCYWATTLEVEGSDPSVSPLRNISICRGQRPSLSALPKDDHRRSTLDPHRRHPP